MTEKAFRFLVGPDAKNQAFALFQLAEAGTHDERLKAEFMDMLFANLVF
jgi:hypothetical protein